MMTVETDVNSGFKVITLIEKIKSGLETDTHAITTVMTATAAIAVTAMTAIEMIVATDVIDRIVVTDVIAAAAIAMLGDKPQFKV
jgi:hypothetical protein